MAISSSQARAARALLAHDQKEIHLATGISVNQISTFEIEKAGMSAKNLGKLRSYFEGHGLELIDGGVRQKQDNVVSHLKGRDGFRIFMNEVYRFASHEGGRISIMNGSPSLFIKWLGKEWYEMHTQRMAQLKDKVDFRIIVEAGNTNFIARDFAEYRWLPREHISEDALYFFGRTVAFFTFHDETLDIVVCTLPESSRQIEWMFDFAWRQAQEAG